MSSTTLNQEQTFKFMLKASLCAAAPAVVPFVLLISSNAVNLLNLTGLGRLGVAAGGVLFIFLANLFWKGRWWAGLPALAVSVGAAILFILKIVRPLNAYFKANPVNDIGDVTGPLFMLSPALVVIVISVTLSWVIFKGIRLNRQLEPRPVTMIMWSLCLLWALVLAGDAYYQNSGWRHFNHPSALIVRLCTDDPGVQMDITERLMNVGPAAVPELVLAVGVKDADLGCLRTRAREILINLGPAAGQPLLDEALKGNITAVTMLGELDLKGAAKPLYDHYKNPKREKSKEYDAALKATIRKLDPDLVPI